MSQPDFITRSTCPIPAGEEIDWFAMRAEELGALGFLYTEGTTEDDGFLSMAGWLAQPSDADEAKATKPKRGKKAAEVFTPDDVLNDPVDPVDVDGLTDG